MPASAICTASRLDKLKIDRAFCQGVQASSRSLSLLYGVARLSAELDLAVTVAPASSWR
jgi:EAL domain-containing protein (putative c-di-GMP-specific phosphodiesterase class I)